jgi:type VI protein secretion system component VasK
VKIAVQIKGGTWLYLDWSGKVWGLFWLLRAAKLETARDGRVSASLRVFSEGGEEHPFTIYFEPDGNGRPVTPALLSDIKLPLTLRN